MVCYTEIRLVINWDNPYIYTEKLTSMCMHFHHYDMLIYILNMPKFIVLYTCIMKYLSKVKHHQFSQTFYCEPMINWPWTLTYQDYVTSRNVHVGLNRLLTPKKINKKSIYIKKNTKYAYHLLTLKGNMQVLCSLNFLSRNIRWNFIIWNNIHIYMCLKASTRHLGILFYL